LVPRGEPVAIRGRTVEPVYPPYDDLAEYVGAVLREVPGTTCLAEHFLATPADPFLTGLPAHVVTLGQEVYFALAPEDLATTIAPYLSWHCTLGVGSFGKDVFAAETLSPGDVDVFAASSQLVAIPAYDGAGFLVWLRRTSP